MSQNGDLHHLGFAVGSISKVAEQFATSTAACWDGKLIYDPVQRVRGDFFQPRDTRNLISKLVEPACEGSSVSNFLKRGPGLHHVCYEIDDLELALGDARATRFAIMAAPESAVAFGGPQNCLGLFQEPLIDGVARA